MNRLQVVGWNRAQRVSNQQKIPVNSWQCDGCGNVFHILDEVPNTREEKVDVTTFGDPQIAYLISKQNYCSACDPS